MDLTPYVERLHRDLLAAAEGAGEETRQAAERLGFALDPAARLALMEAVSQAAAEITAEMVDGGVDVRLDGRDLGFRVHTTPTSVPEPPVPPEPPEPPEAEDDGAVSRLTLRLPEAVKSRVEEAAARSGQSVNTWLVGVVRAAVREAPVRVDVDLSSLPLPTGFDPFRGKSGGRRLKGWL